MFNKLKIPNLFGNKKQREAAVDDLTAKVKELRKWQLENEVKIVPAIQRVSDDPRLPSVITDRAVWYLKPMTEAEVLSLANELRREEDEEAEKNKNK